MSDAIIEAAEMQVRALKALREECDRLREQLNSSETAHMSCLHEISVLTGSLQRMEKERDYHMRFATRLCTRLESMNRLIDDSIQDAVNCGVMEPARPQVGTIPESQLEAAMKELNQEEAPAQIPYSPSDKPISTVPGAIPAFLQKGPRDDEAK